MEHRPRSACDDESTHAFCHAAPAESLNGARAVPSASGLSQRLAANSRVAILTLSFWPKQAGMELMIHNLAAALTNAGDLVTLYAPKPKGPFEEIPHNYRLKRFTSEEHFLEMFRVQHSILPVDVLLVQGALEAASMALKLKEELRVPVILRTHGEDIQVDDDTGYGYRRDPIKRAIIESNIQRVDGNVVIGEHIAPLITQIAPQAVVKTIHNGVDTARFRPQQTRYLRDELMLEDDRPILLTVGRNVKKKALHLAVHALSRVLERLPRAVLVHAGKDGNGENLLETARALGVHASFFALGEVSYFDTPLLYASADLFVFPSKVETFGNVTVEALSSGLPCVEFDYSVNRQKITSGRNGYVIPFGQVEELADRIVELLVDPDKRRAFSEEARTAAAETFAWPRVAKEYRCMFREFRGPRTDS
jgi:glycosyltransferase involved in cell wall biosynthesis